MRTVLVYEGAIIPWPGLWQVNPAAGHQPTLLLFTMNRQYGQEAEEVFYGREHVHPFLQMRNW